MASAEAPAVDEAVLVAHIRELLATADMESMTGRGLRQALEAELGVSLDSKKAFIMQQARLRATRLLSGLKARPARLTSC
jgi:hypothetical protein